MVRLHDSSRRQICMVLFLGLCVLPTLAIGGWAIVRRLPWERQAEAARLAGELGLDVSIDAMAHTQPGVVRYTGLKLADPETGRELLCCDEVEATWTSMTDSHGQTRPAVVLAARQIESTASAWQRLRESLRRRLERQSGTPEIEVRVTAKQWTLREGGDLQVLENVEGGIGLTPEGIRALLEFRIAGGSKSPVRMQIVRNRRVSPPAYAFDLDTAADCMPPSVATLIRALAPSDESQNPLAQPNSRLARLLSAADAARK